MASHQWLMSNCEFIFAESECYFFEILGFFLGIIFSNTSVKVSDSIPDHGWVSFHLFFSFFHFLSVVKSLLSPKIKSQVNGCLSGNFQSYLMTLNISQQY